MTDSKTAQKNGSVIPKTVFVVSPIGTPGTVEAHKASLALEYIIRQALPAPEWDVIRADEEKDPGSITQKVIDRIVTSDLIVADLTDCNPNVFYELAVAHGYKKPVVTIMTYGQKVPFDIVDMRTVFYDLADPASVHSAKGRLADSAREALSNPNQTNPLVTYAMFSTASNGADATPDDKLEFAMGQVLARLGQIERRIEAADSPSPVKKRVGMSLVDQDLRREQDLLAFKLGELEGQIHAARTAEEETGKDHSAELNRLGTEYNILRRKAESRGMIVVSGL